MSKTSRFKTKPVDGRAVRSKFCDMVKERSNCTYGAEWAKDRKKTEEAW